MSYEHEVEVRLAPEFADERLRRMREWCDGWQIEMRPIEPAMPGTCRLAFQDPRLARAFVSHFGGVLVRDDEAEQAMAADERAEGEYDRLAREYDFDD